MHNKKRGFNLFYIFATISNKPLFACIDSSCIAHIKFSRLILFLFHHSRLSFGIYLLYLSFIASNFSTALYAIVSMFQCNHIIQLFLLFQLIYFLSVPLSFFFTPFINLCSNMPVCPIKGS